MGLLSQGVEKDGGVVTQSGHGGYAVTAILPEFGRYGIPGIELWPCGGTPNLPNMTVIRDKAGHDCIARSVQNLRAGWQGQILPTARIMGPSISMVMSSAGGEPVPSIRRTWVSATGLAIAGDAPSRAIKTAAKAGFMGASIKRDTASSGSGTKGQGCQPACGGGIITEMSCRGKHQFLNIK